MAIRVQLLPTRSNFRKWHPGRMPPVRRTRALYRLHSCFCTVSGLAFLICAGARAADTSADRQHVTALADRYVTEFRMTFPIQYDFSGLATNRHDGLDVNSAAALAKWRNFEKGLDTELHQIRPDALVGRPEWVTWHFLNQALKQDAATLICRNELWSVSPLGWQAALSQLASIQPVGTAEARAQALARWRKLPAWIDQEIANLTEGQRLGYSATRAAVQSTIGQLDGLVDGPVKQSGYLSPAERDKTPAFVDEWNRLITGSVLPSLRRYRDFLRDEYLPHARQAISIETHPKGRECYRGLIFATVTVDEEPNTLYDIAVNQVAKERDIAVKLGRKLYGPKATDWNVLAKLVIADPNSRFSSADEIRDYTQRTYQRAYAAAGRMVLTPPVGQVKLEPFPQFQQASAPGGQYVPAADDGSRPATYYYRNVPKDLYRPSLQNVILHETLPGHHLQICFLTEHGHKGDHPISRLLFFSGPGEGWATYAEDFAHEIGLYDSDLDYIGRLMSSITPMMVVDLGMQVKGWTSDQAAAYLREAMPLRPAERAVQSVALISGSPGFVLAYPLGDLQWEKMRAHAEASLGKRFDVRAFHQMELEDGMLPFVALQAKLDRWIEASQTAH
jgi:uncharacterized protein (DUF885 family)